uniref:Uncharacterized protein n=1 Tax=Rhizophora mucronata TaxID=61149 RepID=A0A2P2NV44_RHIMU
MVCFCLFSCVLQLESFSVLMATILVHVVFLDSMEVLILSFWFFWLFLGRY